MYADVQWVGENIYEGFKDRNVDDTATIQADLEGKIGDDLMKIFLLFENQMKHMKNEMQNMKNGVESAMKFVTGQSGQEMDRKKYKMLISEYRKFKARNVKHFRFHSDASSFGESWFTQAMTLKRKL